ncbi:MAG: hypothetical protein JJ971_06790 [Balneolaceae bacterium]|nr:hypothetical protein [Balneolaceae bacterium]MBO6546081.1 hypothetical protein [Balneolaceae bacterium]MBO6647477.1 hypothetical protein [Balneolaceae bacterium]
MKTKHFLLFVLLVLIIIIVSVSTEVLGQPALPSAPSQAPIDGGLGLLAAAGGAYGLKKLREKKGKNPS